ncbi:hypothetical protein [Halomonas sp. CKK8]|uniref:hypothetical protein n=1 Tax=Halomonas sp. CKK8 TaxID=3036127 RepID=UPI00241524A4|nr:hypothetical protein [Halomonas sp. CKK8]WFM72905.1 hypothetical protein P8934_07905 [Halomonas sp. CKK8]
MIDIEFWQDCIEAGCVIVPVVIYSDYGSDGEIDEGKRIGLRFAALPCEDMQLVVSEGTYCMIDESISGLEHFHKNPKSALAEFRGAS